MERDHSKEKHRTFKVTVRLQWDGQSPCAVEEGTEWQIQTSANRGVGTGVDT